MAGTGQKSEKPWTVRFLFLPLLPSAVRVTTSNFSCVMISGEQVMVVDQVPSVTVTRGYSTTRVALVHGGMATTQGGTQVNAGWSVSHMLGSIHSRPSWPSDATSSTDICDQRGCASTLR